DHMEILGENLTKIAIEKAGIMKIDVICLSAYQNNEVTAALQSMASLKGTPLHFLNGKKTEIAVHIPGEKQKENTELALLVLDHLNGFNISDLAIMKGLNSVRWHGRNQMVQDNPPVIFDVAHNVDGFRCFLDYYQSLEITGPSILVLALYLRKQIQDIIPDLESSFQYIICTETGGHKQMPAEILGSHFSSNHSVDIIKDSTKAIQKGLGRLSSKGCMAILGTHCLGPAVNEIFKISFDSL
ncbi:uncharacterized protein METZ01_LOCUS467985, partial [marine metagenome]